MKYPSPEELPGWGIAEVNLQVQTHHILVKISVSTNVDDERGYRRVRRQYSKE